MVSNRDHEGSAVQDGKDWGAWCALGNANVYWRRGQGVIVESDGGTSVRQERLHPPHHREGKTSLPEYLNHAPVVDIVRRSL